VGIDKAPVKAKIRKYKKKRDEAIAAHDHGALKLARRQRHRLNRKIRQAIV
jgi:hypothetical protein